VANFPLCAGGETAETRRAQRNAEKKARIMEEFKLEIGNFKAAGFERNRTEENLNGGQQLK